MPVREPRFNQATLDMSPPNMQPWKMSPPTLSPLHMTPPNMLLPDFSPPSFPLPALSASQYFPPPSLFEEFLDEGPSAMAFSRVDPSLLVIGTSANGTPENPAGMGGGGSILFYKVLDLEMEVRGDAAFPPDDPRRKIRPDMHLIKTIPVPAPIMSIMFSPHDGNMVLATTSAGTVHVLKIRNGSIKLKSTHALFPDRPGGIIRAAAFSPKDKYLLAASLSTSSSIVLFDIEDINEDNSIEVLAEFQADQRGVVRTLAFSADGKKLYTGGDDSTLREWEISVDQNDNYNINLVWSESSSHDGEAIASILVWPSPDGPDKDCKRTALLTGSNDGQFRTFDLSSPTRPPTCTQTMNLEEQRKLGGEAGGALWFMTPLPPLPILERKYQTDDSLPVGIYSPESTSRKDLDLDPEFVGVVTASTSGLARVLVQRQNFHQVFIGPHASSFPDDPEFEKKFYTADGVKMDWEGREMEFEWYDVVDFKEHIEICGGQSGSERNCGGVYAVAAVSIVDWDPMYKESGIQRKRRGWRVATSAFGERKVLIFQIYVDG